MGQKLQRDGSQVQSHRGHRTFGKACVPGTDLGTMNYRETKSLSSCHGHSNEPASLQGCEKSNGQDGVVSRPWSQLALRERLEATRAMSREQNVQMVTCQRSGWPTGLGTQHSHTRTSAVCQDRSLPSENNCTPNLCSHGAGRGQLANRAVHAGGGRQQGGPSAVDCDPELAAQLWTSSAAHWMLGGM